MSQLNIYKASAGSGKTHKLTGDYLKLALQSPNNFRHILAVTFTNKATEEMKNRIIREMYIISCGGASDYTKDIANEFNISELKLQERANHTLTRILHDYSRFSVETIERFFQKILRAFTRETGLPSGYEIELDNEKVLHEVTDQVIMNIDEDETLREWLTDFASAKMEEGKSWNFKRDLSKLGLEVFKEEYLQFNQQLVKKIKDKDFLKDYLRELRKIISVFENTQFKIAEEALSVIKDIGLTTSDFKGGAKGFIFHFEKILQKKFAPTPTVLKACNTPEAWHAKESPHKDNILKAYHDGLNDKLTEAIDHYERNYRDYYTALNISSNIYTLGILTDITEEIQKYTDENNLFLLSDAAKLLSVIISDNEAPYIYEKTGNIYHNHMIDEFQDTSSLQWNNFKPLITNSLSENNFNLIVGDVKQSIYRWRNSDWEILASHVENEFSQLGTKTIPLLTNWRSKKNVVSFNNNIFSHAPIIIQQKLNSFLSDEEQESNLSNMVLNAYDDCTQHLPGKEYKQDGYVKLQFVDDEFDDFIEEEVPAVIKGLLDKGYRAKDIAILVRAKKHGKIIADTILGSETLQNYYPVQVVSEEILYLHNSTSVRILISLLRYMIFPEDSINKALFLHEYHQYLKNDDENKHTLFSEYPGNDKNLLESIYLSEEQKSLFQKLKYLPLYEITERLIDILGLNQYKEELPYLETFQNCVLNYTLQDSSDIHSFLQWWEEKGIDESLPINEGQDAVTISTIHKAKGLQYKAVIIPYCDWKLDHSNPASVVLWSKPKHSPFDKLDLVPLNYKSELTSTHFGKDYLVEKTKAHVDNLNLLYVAFTRAINALFVFCPYKNNNKKINTCADLLRNVIHTPNNTEDTQENQISFSGHLSEDNLTLEIGSLEKMIQKEEEREEEELQNEMYLSTSSRHKLRIKNEGYDFFDKEENYNQNINYGKLMHEVFRNIKTINDVGKALKKMQLQGRITAAQKKELNDNITSVLQNKQAADWFSDEWEVKTEKDILLKTGHTIRPDRVLIKNNKAIVIDYKFGKHEDPAYIEQIKKYKENLKKMGYQDVEGYVWYVETDKIVS